MNDYKEKLDELSAIFELTDNKEPSDAVLVCRQVLEKAIDLVFSFEKVAKPNDAQLLELINNECIRGFFNSDVMIDSLHFVRIVGINAYHGKYIKSTQAKVAHNNIEYLLAYLKDRILNDHKPSETKTQDLEAKLKKEMSEAETRAIYIDLFLNEAGWEVVAPNTTITINDGRVIKCGSPIPGKACSEIPTKGLKNVSGIGFCDYVLYGKDGKPLAIVEAKKTSVDPIVGQQQVREYGECFKQEFGYVPILYYTNGYNIFVIDGKYPPRKVMAFHNIDELTYLIQKRSIKKISDFSIDENISGRPYQKIAITKICERFNEMQRKALLVMATGTGKTRVAISLVDILTRNNWVKNVLFLADRTSLVEQAFKNFKKLLPNMSYCVLSDRSLADEPNARITFSTHQTMINFIDSETKEYSIGRFDLIIIDEAHRSIFNKFGSIFDYFDSLLIGLTATPKDEVDANTYSLFNCETGAPNFSYSLEDAVKDHYLVPYNVVNKTTTLMKSGIKYGDLSEEDKEKVDTVLEDETGDEDVLPSNLLFTKIYNKDTCRTVIEDLMKYGIRVRQGQTLGKTIIFAYNHVHAKLIVDTFNEMYPQYPDCCILIDNKVKNSNHLIDEFGEKEEFRIAVSVDMLDTGIDIPAVLNLVFFKKVKSNIKFIQMIGRGTRLCPGVLDGADKTKFLIFDYCSNFEYFGMNVDGEEPRQTISITQKLFELRLKIMCELQKVEHQNNMGENLYYKELNNELFTVITSIKDHTERISVRDKMSVLNKYCDKERWQYISPLDQKEIVYNLEPLIDSDINDDYLSYSFDYRMLQLEYDFSINGNLDKSSNIIKGVRVICRKLLDMSSINEISNKSDILKAVYNGEVWESMNIDKLEYYRKNIRDLLKYIKPTEIEPVIIDESDESLDSTGVVPESFDIRTYEEKVLNYLYKNSNNPTIIKIKNLEPLNSKDFDALENILWVKLGTKDDYYQITKIDNLAAFIRTLVGIDQDAVNKKFEEFIDTSQLTGEQLEFVHSIINYVRENGDVVSEDLIDDSPFNNYNLMDVFGNNIPVVNKVVDIMHNCIKQ